MNCPKCSNENVQITSRTKNNASGWWGVIGIFIGFTLMLGPIVGILGAIIGAVAMSFAPKTETVAICQNCGNTFDPKTKKELK